MSWYFWEKYRTVLLCLPVPSFSSSNPDHTDTAFGTLGLQPYPLVPKGVEFPPCVCSHLCNWLTHLCTFKNVHATIYIHYLSQWHRLAFKCLDTAMMVTFANLDLLPEGRTTLLLSTSCASTNRCFHVINLSTVLTDHYMYDFLFVCVCALLHTPASNRTAVSYFVHTKFIPVIYYLPFNYKA